ncbi:RICIN domain-containing protein [Kitasatospora sp. CMC57]|uniref:RICIN domain-containing protein n=1 Tax=Kitasatospora sp. CMC57 TaxID=3231513 RepID=UPI0038B62B3B
MEPERQHLRHRHLADRPLVGVPRLRRPGTRTYGSQTANVITVQGSPGNTYVYTVDRCDASDLGASKLIWLPLTIRGTAVNLGDVPSQSATAGVLLQQWTCNGQPNQQWALDLTGSYTGRNYVLVGVGSGLTMGVAGSTAQGAAEAQELGGGASANSETWTVS